MALGNKLIDSALRNAIYPTVLFICLDVPITDYSKIRNNRTHIYSHREDSNTSTVRVWCVHQLNLDPFFKTKSQSLTIRRHFDS